MSKQNWQALKSGAIIANIEKVIRTKNIELLRKSSYDFLYLMSGFIAHYDINGFKDHYSDVDDLINDIRNSVDITDPERMVRDKWFENEYGEAYCNSKAEIFRALNKLTK
jgi:hypothetical protein